MLDGPSASPSRSAGCRSREEVRAVRAGDAKAYGCADIGSVSPCRCSSGEGCCAITSRIRGISAASWRPGCSRITTERRRYRGLRRSLVYSCRTPLGHLATLTCNTVRFGDALPITVLSRPTPPDDALQASSASLLYRRQRSHAARCQSLWKSIPGVRFTCSELTTLCSSRTSSTWSSTTFP
jgi:hypothetical protein